MRAQLPDTFESTMTDIKRRLSELEKRTTVSNLSVSDGGIIGGLDVGILTVAEGGNGFYDYSDTPTLNVTVRNSGRLLVMMTALISGVLGDTLYFAPQVQQGGDIIHAAQDRDAIMGSSVDGIWCFGHAFLEDLTPGDSTVYMMGKANVGGVIFATQRSMTIVPL